MTDTDFQNKTKALIDSLKSISANYGLGNDGNEFKINILLKFDNNGMKTVTKQIESSRYFEWSITRVLAKFPEKETIVKQDTTINGIWKNDENGYYFEFYGDWSEPVFAKIDTIERTLKFTFVHL